MLRERSTEQARDASKISAAQREETPLVLTEGATSLKIPNPCASSRLYRIHYSFTRIEPTPVYACANLRTALNAHKNTRKATKTEYT